MIYDYIIVGLGPTGITLGLNLLKTDKKVLFIESDKKIGGCWNIDYTNDGYFTEHSPKVLSKTGSKQFNKLLKYLDISSNYINVYKNSTFFSITKTIFREFLILDIIKLLIFFHLYIFSVNDKNINIKKWCEISKISSKAKRFLNILSVAISNTYDKLTMHAFIHFMFSKYQYLYDLQQLPKPNEWLDAVQNKFKLNTNFHFLMNTYVKRFNISNDKTVSYLITNDDKILRANNYLCCVPLRSLYTIMNNSFEPNWFPSIHQFKYFVDKSSYTGIGFQLHYEEYFKLPEQWCWSCVGDWKIIVLDRTHVLDKISYEQSIKQVLSCVIVDLDSRSTYLKKTVNECNDLDEIVKEGLRQINELGDIHSPPQKITISNHLNKSKDFGWESRYSSFSPSIGKLPYKGKLKNLYSIAPHNRDEVVIIETAIQNAQIFSKQILEVNNVF
tara:strand:- start:2978 stop:4306 length:1329 start_codon:yes stop_codon:yes gene_type:complete